jgi:hypothetical protein
MAGNRLKPPKSVRIDFKPSPRQYELWKLLQPNAYPLCGGRIEQVLIGYDVNHNPQYKPECWKCYNQDLPQLILGGGAAGGGKSYVGSIEYLSENYEIEQELNRGKYIAAYNRRITFPIGAHIYFEGKICEVIRSISGYKAPSDIDYWEEFLNTETETDPAYSQFGTY